MHLEKRSFSIALVTLAAMLSVACGLGEEPLGPKSSNERNQPPTVTILTPADGALIWIGSETPATAEARDPEQGALWDSVNWTSSVDGPLGVGRAVSLSTLSAASHTLIVEARDEDLGKDTDSVRVVVKDWLVAGIGGAHSCGITTDKDMYCWGVNESGQLGDGTLNGRHQPAPVEAELEFDTLSLGDRHTCALASGTAYCWGLNDRGQLGDGTTTSRSTPVRVAGGLVFEALAAGAGHTCGIAAGRAYCWGANDARQLGLGSGDGADRTAPTPVSGSLSLTTIAAGAGHTCAVDAAADVYCWGDNAHGQLGDGTTEPRTAPTPAIGGWSFKAISAGDGHTCGITSFNRPYCWGDNRWGQLGIGHRNDWLEPRQSWWGVGDVQAIQAGGRHSCATNQYGDAFCWGGNMHGQLGRGFYSAFETYNLVAGERDFIALFGGTWSTCGLRGRRELLCWGVYQLGDGPSTVHLEPRHVADP